MTFYAIKTLAYRAPNIALIITNLKNQKGIKTVLHPVF
ncbi:hypothetical protein FM120_00745 [Sphingobacterium faecium PCAi_F2.5]|nr:hypothetical protein FM120_00745 [Sphingobacterium faecium PCAi_F2.5]